MPDVLESSQASAPQAPVSPRAGPTASERLRQDPDNFSFVLGGPLYQLLRRSHLAGGAQELVRRRIVVISLFVWLPLLVLSAVDGKLLSGSVPISFLQDVEVHVRFLLVVPLLIAAELIVHQRTRTLLRQFLERNLIPEAAMPQFDAAVASAVRLRNSVTAEILIIAIVYGVGVFVVFRNVTVLHTLTWYATPSGAGSDLSLAGMWYGYVSLPVFQFLLLRWYYRIAIWTYFLFRVSRIDLALVPAHPDRVGGLGFLSNTILAFIPLLFAHGTLAAGLMANRIFYAGAKLVDFKVEVGVLVVFCTCLVLIPLLVFAPQLAQAKLKGSREFGIFAERYTRGFEAKWLRGGAPPDEPLLGSGDIQSLADLGNSFEIVKTMRLAPFTRQAVVQLVAFTIVPMTPLLLTIMPFEELMKRLLGMLL
jgi:hypothetical protein